MDIRIRRLASQGLSGDPERTPDAAVGRLLAVQAQDGRGFRLAVRSRTAGLSAGEVDAALDSRRLLVTWLNRGTLHLVRSEDYRWLHALTAPRVVRGVERRLGQLGVDVPVRERGVSVIVSSLQVDGPLDRRDLRDRLDDEGVPTAGQALVHLLALASLRGHVVRGPVIGGRHAFVAVDDWLGPSPAAVDRDEALGRIARRYLEGHGPATPRDLATWAGITLGVARSAFDRVDVDLHDVPGGSVIGRVRPVDELPTAPARLLGPFDPILHGWHERSPFVGPHRSVVTANGIFRAACLVGGRVVGTWTLPGGSVEIALLERVGVRQQAALHRDAADVLRFLGRENAPVRVSGP